MTTSIIASLRRVKFLLALLFFICSSTVQADVVTGRVVDKESGEPLEQVQVEVRDVKGSGMRIYFTVTDSLGRFTTWNANGDYTEVECNLIGYHSYTKKLMLLGTEKDTCQLGDIRLTLSDILLRNAEVRAKARTFVVRGDTVVFNPQAFRLPEGARLSELISKLPGVTQENGALQWMGKPIRILMEGKELFANTDLLTQTLPAEAVERIKAYDKADDLEQRTGRKDGKEDYVLDLKIKPGFLERWYGSVEATYETTDKYKAYGDATYLSTRDPFLVATNVGNNNKFVTNRGIGTYGFGGGGTGGKQQMGAVSYKHGWDRKQGRHTLDNHVTVDFNLSHCDSWKDDATSREVFYPESAPRYNHSFTHDWKHSLQPSGRLTLNLRPDTMTRVNLEAQAQWEKQRRVVTHREGAFTSDPYLLTERPLDGLFRHPDSLQLLPITLLRTFHKDKTTNENFNGQLTATYIRQLKGEGEVNLRADYQYDQERAVSDFDRRTDYFTTTQADIYQHQMERKPQHRHRFQFNADYNQWLGEKVKFSAGYNFQLHRGTTRLNLYDLHLITSSYDPTRPVPEALLKDVLDRGNSYNDQQVTGTHDVNVNLEVNLGKWRLSPSVRATYKHEKMDYERGALDTVAYRRAWVVSPRMNLYFAPSRTSAWEASYSYDNRLPELLSTLAYYDNTRPLHTSEGNPHLGRSGKHNAWLSYRANLPKHQQVLRLRLDYGKAVNPVSSLVRYHTQTGAYHTKPVHVRGGDDCRFSTNFTQFFKEAWEFSNDLQFSFASDYSYLQQTELMPLPLLNRHRMYQVSEAPSLTYRANAYELKVGGEYAYTHYDNSAYTSSFDHTMYYKAYISGRYSWRSFIFRTDFTLDGYAGYSTPELNRVVPLWNVSAEYKFLRNKASLEVGFDDILNKNKGYYGFVSNYMRAESRFFMRHHYFWVSFNYRFDAKRGR